MLILFNPTHSKQTTDIEPQPGTRCKANLPLTSHLLREGHLISGVKKWMTISGQRQTWGPKLAPDAAPWKRVLQMN